jgi:hypothetical protein
MFPEPIMPTSIATFRGFVRRHPPDPESTGT